LDFSSLDLGGKIGRIAGGSARLRDCLNFADGKFVETGIWFDNISPVNGELIGRVAMADSSLVDFAVDAARDATAPLRVLTPGGRAELLREVAALIEDRFDEFVSAECLDTGKPHSEASNLDIPRAIANFRFFANLVEGESESSFATCNADSADAVNFIIRRPLGVVGIICPWNLPLLLLSWKVAPALACGNSVIVKPSEETPLSATLLAEVISEVSFPPGAFNLLHGHGSGSVGEMLVVHSGVDAITFTGESATGSKIMRAAAGNTKALSFELGGKNPAIVFDDADLDAAIRGTAKSVFTNSGQICLCTERIYVQRGVFDSFLDGLKRAAEAVVFDDPLTESLQMGPLISKAHRDKVLGYCDLALKEGANLVTGGGIPCFFDERDSGFYLQPTIWTGLSNSARVVREEIFGPVCHVAPFDREEEVIDLCNDSVYGLAATVWTRDLDLAHKVAAELEVGMVWVNTWYLRDLRAPFGGVKSSGIGREGGQYSLDFYAPPSNVCVSSDK
jgi:aminomuconate-semialdehyde/2-hydroxymuconate-6-semialdehyde dehydrogenase